MSNSDSKTLGTLMMEAMREKGLNQSHIAKKMNMSRQTINTLDTRKSFTVDFLIRFKEASGLDFTGYADSIIENRSVSKEPSIKSDPPSKDALATLTLNFGLPPESYEHIAEFMKQLTGLAEKHGIKVL